MRVSSTNIEIETIFSCIKRERMNLQPDFQRGQVWSISHKKKLIDSILRGWHIPPIYILENEMSGQLEVLDGQQRLLSIYEFICGDFSIDGYISPYDHNICMLDGKYFDELPENWKYRILKFSLSMYRIMEYRPEEPSELFYRLNQSVSLTAAEKRNAYYGPVREQVKNLLNTFYKNNLGKEVLGFSNSRLAYEDTIAKVCFIVYSETLKIKVSSSKITDIYRLQEPFPDHVIWRVENAIYYFGNAVNKLERKVRFNKATLFSWLCFVISLMDYNSNIFDEFFLTDFIYYFESYRSLSKNTKEFLYYNSEEQYIFKNNLKNGFGVEEELINIFNDKASSRVADVSSVITRDIIMWFYFHKFVKELGLNKFDYKYQMIAMEHIPHNIKGEDIVGFCIYEYNWGEKI